MLSLAAPILAACSSISITAPKFDDDADVKILFIGNSLTYVHDVPGLVRQLAAHDDLSVSTATIAYPDYALEDHWNNGIADEIRRLRADIVVMQQGPSSLLDSRTHLVHWSQQLAAVVREAGGEPALYMVWPDVTRRFAFPDVEASYAQAAQAVGGRLLPAGTTWLRAWDQNSDLPSSFSRTLDSMSVSEWFSMSATVRRLASSSRGGGTSLAARRRSWRSSAIVSITSTPGGVIVVMRLTISSVVSSSNAPSTADETLGETWLSTSATIAGDSSRSTRPTSSPESPSTKPNGCSRRRRW
jgi:hypothetical protein